jgi:hypothetical protein
MKKVLLFLSIACVFAVVFDARAQTGKDPGQLQSAVIAPSPPAVVHAPCFVEQKIICYKAVQKERIVPIEVARKQFKVVDEPYKYVEMVKIVTPEKRIETFYACVTKDVPYTYKVCVPVTVPEHRTVPYLETIQREITIKVPACKTVQRTCVDPCTGCPYTVTQHVIELQDKKVMVCQLVPKTKDVTVNVRRIAIEERAGVYKVKERVPQSREVDVQVVSCRPMEKTGVCKRIISETVVDRVNVRQVYCEMVPYEVTVRVPVCK